jgi:predicted ATPase with chaperone activity
VVAGAIRPGEFSLAHGGVLLADELPEWSRDSRESLREPLERGKVSLNRTQASADLPARFILAANGNLCPCGGWPRLLRAGYDGAQTKLFPCICKDSEVSTYLRRLSGPVLDRIDIIQLVLPLRSKGMEEQNASDTFRLFKERTEIAQELGGRTWGMPPGLLGAAEIEAILKDHPTWRDILNRRKNVGMRSRHKIVRIALSLAIFERVEGGMSSTSLPLPLPLPAERHFEESFYLRPEGLNLHFIQE